MSFSDNFDGEIEGTSPPANWILPLGRPLAIAEVDDVHFSSSPHAMWTKANAVAVNNWDSVLTDRSVNNDDIIGWKSYFPIQQYYMFHSKSGVGGAGVLLNAIICYPTGEIKVYDGTVITDTGFSYTTASFKRFRLIHNFIAKTVDVYYDGALIASGYDFYDNTATSMESFRVFCHSFAGSEMWTDDFLISLSSMTIKNIILKNTVVTA